MPVFTSPRTWTRETRLLVLTVVISGAVLAVLAQFRFPEQRRVETIAQPLEQIAARATYEELAAIIGRLQPRIAPSVVVLRAAHHGESNTRTLQDVAIAPTADAPIFVPALRLRPDIVIARLAPGLHVEAVVGDAAAVPIVLSTDALRGIVLVRVPAPAEGATWQWQAARTVPTPSYVGAVEGTRGGATVRPLFLGRSDRFQESRWDVPLLALGATPVAAEGAFVVALDGTVLGMTTEAGGSMAVVPTDALTAAADALLSGEPAPLDFGLTLQPMNAAVARAVGGTAGVVVAAVAPGSLADGVLRPGDVVTAIGGEPVAAVDLALVRLARAAPGSTVRLAVRRGTGQLEVEAVADPSPPTATLVGVTWPGLTLVRGEAGARRRRRARRRGGGRRDPARRRAGPGRRPDAAQRARGTRGALRRAGRRSPGHRRRPRRRPAGGRPGAPVSTPHPPAEARSELGRDVIDSQLGARPPLRLLDLLGRTRAALGLRPLTAPALLLVPLGYALGPAGAGVLPLTVLGYLYPVVAVGLAALGIFVGFGLRLDAPSERRLLIIASLESAITIAVVAGAAGLLLTRWALPMGVPVTTAALALGLAASASAASTTAPGDPLAVRVASRVADLDDVLPILAGGVVLAMAVSSTAAGAGSRVALAVVFGGCAAGAGWLLFDPHDDSAERGVLVTGTVALIGGGAAYVGTSPLLSGMVAGLCWRYLPGHADRMIADDLRRLQHPLVVLLLVFLGANAVPGAIALWLLGPFVIFRLTGKLFAGWAVSRLARDVVPPDLGSYLLPPGVIGLASALAFHQVSGTAGSLAILSAVAAGTLLSELIAAVALLTPRRD